MFFKTVKSTSSLLLFLLLSLKAGAEPSHQPVNLPLGHWAYDFIERMEAKRVISGIRMSTKPISRIRMARILASVEKSPGFSDLTQSETEQLKWLQREFSSELSLREPRRHLLSLRGPDESLLMFIDPVFKLRYGKGSSPLGNSLIAGGGQTYGYFGRHIGFYFSHVQTVESEMDTERSRRGIPTKGIESVTKFLGGAAIRETKTSISVGFPWFSAELGLGSNLWGPGRRGQLALSDHSPDYGYIRLSARLGHWGDFTYLFSSLRSGIVDSVRSYDPGTGFFRPLERQKYFAGNRLEVTLHPGVDLGLSESVIYGDRDFELLYLIPINFLWDAQHYLKDPDNASLSADLDISLIGGVKLYGALFIDELELDNIFNKEKHRNHLGFQFGVLSVDPLEFVRDWDFRLEYTRLNPWVYTHKYPVNTFENFGYSLGHWIGQNGDDLYFEANYRPNRQFRFSLFYERRRKGGQKSVIHQYQHPAEPFLYGEVAKGDFWGLGLQYELLRDLFFGLDFKRIPSPEWPYYGDGESGESLVGLKVGYNDYFSPLLR